MLEKSADFIARMDKITPIAIAILCVFGVLGIYSSGSFRGSDEWFKQIIFIALGGIVYLLLAGTPPKFFKDNAIIIYLAGTALLVPIAIAAILHTNFGNFIHDVNGSRRWYFLGSFGIQPSEFAKIAALIFMAKVLSFSPLSTFRKSLGEIAKAIGIMAVPAALIVVEPDLGSTLVYPPMTLALLWMAGLRSRFFITIFAIGAIIGGVIAVDIYFYRERIIDYYEAQDQRPRDPARDIRGQYQAVSWVPLKDYQRERLLSFIDPETIDPRGIGSSWNVRQSLICVGKGGLTGAGFSNGMQAKLGYLPELAAHNDFLFSVIAEEYGFAGCATIVALYLLMLLRTTYIAFRMADPFCSLLATGIAMILLIHILINIGMNIGLMPVTGLSLPFMSYGGSFVLSCFILLGILQSIYVHRPKELPRIEVQNFGGNAEILGKRKEEKGKSSAGTLFPRERNFQRQKNFFLFPFSFFLKFAGTRILYSKTFTLPTCGAWAAKGFGFERLLFKTLHVLPEGKLNPLALPHDAPMAASKQPTQ